jgi:predicted alpha/beta hydrolase family esterase
MKKVIVVHGWCGYPEEGWRPWLRSNLEKDGYQVEIPAMPDSKNPNMETWVNYLRQVVGKPNEDVIFIGHSLGVITILRYLETLKANEIIGKAIFVAGFSYDLEYEGYKHELSSFFESPINFEEIKKHCKKFVVLHSQDDKWVPVKHADIFKEKLKAEVIIQDKMNHYSGDDGITELPIMLDLVKDN